jgi:hypothetical protein
MENIKMVTLKDIRNKASKAFDLLYSAVEQVKD